MNTLRNILCAASLALGVLPTLGAAAEPAPPPGSPPPGQGPGPNQDLERRLEDARRRLDEAAREVAQLSSQLGRGFAIQLQGGEGGAPRALLGVSIDNGGGNAGGARVRDVSPGSAAAEAGIKAGDIITSVGGQDLTKENDPGRALVDRMNQAEPNLKLQVGVLRDGRKLSFDVTPRPAPPGAARANQLLGGVLPGLLGPGAGGGVVQLQAGPDGRGQPRIEIRTLRDGADDGTRFRGMEFATLSEKLGSYFGVKSGVLVVRAGANSPFKLQDGDVILAIDGREPTSAQHAGRILRSYRDGEQLKLRVERDHKGLDLEVTMPAGDPDDGHE